MPGLDSSEVQSLNAVEVKRRELRIRIARIRGQLDASAAASKFFARINQDTQIQRQEAEAELLALDESGAQGVLDGWGEFTPLDKAARAERLAGANAGLDWLASNPTSTQAEFVAAVQAGLEARRTADGRLARIHSASGVGEMWLRTAIQEGKASDWPTFRDRLVSASDRTTALEDLD